MMVGDFQRGFHRLKRNLQLDEQTICPPDGFTGSLNIFDSQTTIGSRINGDGVLSMRIDQNQSHSRINLRILHDEIRADTLLSEGADRFISKTIRT